MPVEVLELGEARHPLIILDGALDNVEQVNRVAESLAPYPAATNHYYPGVRRYLSPERDPAYAYVDAVCRGIAPLMRDVFAVERYSVTEASFSMVTQRPDDAEMIQYLPHYDSLDPLNFAVLHYLNPVPRGGTGFYRHRRTGIVMMSPDRYDDYRAGIDRDAVEFGKPDREYIAGSNDAWERLALVEGRYNRLIIYQGALFHSAEIPPDFSYDPDPRNGRLTANIFLRAGGPVKP